MKLADYWDCFPEEILLSLLKRGEINYIQSHNIEYLLSKYKKFKLSFYRLAFIDIEKEILKQFSIRTITDRVVIRVPIFYKFDILPILLSDNFSSEVTIFDREEGTIITLPRDDVILVEFKIPTNQRYFFIFTYDTLIRVYQDNNIVVVEPVKIAVKYDIKVNFTNFIITLIGEELPRENQEESIIAHCILLKELSDYEKRITNFMFKYLREKYKQKRTPKSFEAK